MSLKTETYGHNEIEETKNLKVGVEAEETNGPGFVEEDKSQIRHKKMLEKDQGSEEVGQSTCEGNRRHFFFSELG